MHSVHPNLRHLTRLKFISVEQLQPCDLLFLALPHGMAQTRLAMFRQLSARIIDLSSDFRLRDLQLYKTWYSHDHACPELLPQVVYGMPELHREALAHAALVSGTGCLATATILGLYPLARAGVLSPATASRHGSESRFLSIWEHAEPGLASSGAPGGGALVRTNWPSPYC